VELLRRTPGTGVLWADGRRTFELPGGARVVVRRSPIPVRLARLSPRPFAERLVNKFGLPVAGWRGPTSEGPNPDGPNPGSSGPDGGAFEADTSAAGAGS
jgi:hypothetical protein